MKKTNKFHPHWQIIRVKAKREKEVYSKVSGVSKFLQSYPTKENAARVFNWAIMTKMGYKDSYSKAAFDPLIGYIKENEFLKSEGEIEPLTVLNDKDLLAVYNDLRKRKYGFQFNKTPKDHIGFIEKLELEINKRNKLKK